MLRLKACSATWTMACELLIPFHLFQECQERKRVGKKKIFHRIQESSHWKDV